VTGCSPRVLPHRGQASTPRTNTMCTIKEGHQSTRDKMHHFAALAVPDTSGCARMRAGSHHISKASRIRRRAG
jgi:hypothetical protein